MYNLSIRVLGEEYEKCGFILSFKELKPLIMNTKEYCNITGMYYAVILQAIAVYKKWISTKRYTETKSKKILEKKNLKRYNAPKLKDYYPVFLLKPSIVKRQIIFPSTKKTSQIRLEIPEKYCRLPIERIILKASYNFKSWDLILEYPVQNNINSLDNNKAIGIDLGVTNFATVVSTSGETFIIDGRYIKCLVQGYCKYNSKFRKNSERFNTRRMISLQNRSNNQIRDYIRKSVAYIIKYCIAKQIGNIYIGWGLHFSTFNLGQNTNQLFSRIPFANFKDLLIMKARQNGIEIHTINECYSSQASFLDNDPLPEQLTRTKMNFSGKRKKRGLYQSKTGIKINADVNGSANILRKGIEKFKGNAIDLKVLSSRGLAVPLRINPLY